MSLEINRDPSLRVLSTAQVYNIWSWKARNRCTTFHGRIYNGMMARQQSSLLASGQNKFPDGNKEFELLKCGFQKYVCWVNVCVWMRERGWGRGMGRRSYHSIARLNANVKHASQCTCVQIFSPLKVNPLAAKRFAGKEPVYNFMSVWSGGALFLTWFGHMTSFSILKQSLRSISMLWDISRTLELFWKRKLHVIAEFRAQNQREYLMITEEYSCGENLIGPK